MLICVHWLRRHLNVLVDPFAFWKLLVMGLQRIWCYQALQMSLQLRSRKIARNQTIRTYSSNFALDPFLLSCVKLRNSSKIL
mmetsp:Transcript_22589/g.28957  ORF Transcript_22589/g.28957 Transcript_22589/m.28957 type:complete len:82 (+) Transcript_22589:469-714(+)